MLSYTRILLAACMMAGAVFPAQAQDITHMLVPSNAWLVGPTTLAEGSDVEAVGVPCLMVTSFSNGYEMRISGGNQQIMAMALNVREKSFTPGESYLMTLSFGEEEGFQAAAQAFSEDTLVVGLSQESGFYKDLNNSQSLYVALGDSKMQFSLLGVPQGLKRLEECYQPPAAAAREASNVSSPPANIPAQGLQTLGVDDVAKVKDMVTGDAAPDTVVSEELSEPVSDALPLTADISEVPHQTPEPQEFAPPPVREVSPRDILTTGIAKPVAQTAQNTSPIMQWRVMKGGGLEGVLGIWAQSVNMRLIWQAGQSYSVPQSLSMQSSFEDVVQAVLEQFPTDQPRPVGKIYYDAPTGQKVLLIETVVPEADVLVKGEYPPILSP